LSRGGELWVRFVIVFYARSTTVCALFCRAVGVRRTLLGVAMALRVGVREVVSCSGGGWGPQVCCVGLQHDGVIWRFVGNARRRRGGGSTGCGKLGGGRGRGAGGRRGFLRPLPGATRRAPVGGERVEYSRGGSIAFPAVLAQGVAAVFRVEDCVGWSWGRRVGFVMNGRCDAGGRGGRACTAGVG